MGLFQTSVLKKYIKLQDKKTVEKTFKKHTKYFHNPKRQENIFDIKDKGFQQKFFMELFEEKKTEAQILKSEIDKTDKEIDQMVYELYGLTEDEIKIVEESV